MRLSQDFGLVVGPLRVELRPRGLKGRCSAIKLGTHSAFGFCAEILVPRSGEPPSFDPDNALVISRGIEPRFPDGESGVVNRWTTRPDFDVEILVVLRTSSW